MEIQMLDRVSKITEAVVLASVGIVLLICLNLFYEKLSLFKDSFVELLPYINAALVIRIIFDVSRILFTSKRYKAGVEIINLCISLGITFLLFRKYPFDTSVIGDPAQIDMAVLAVLLIACIGMILSILNNLKDFLLVGGDSSTE